MNILTGFSDSLPSADPSNSVTLPKEAYFDQDFFDLEKQEMWFKTWHYAGWVGELKNVGDYITASLFEQDVIIIRGSNGQLAGFYNVCQHRGHKLLNGSGSVSSIRCPYHSWVYDLNGKLAHARGSETTLSVDVDKIGLRKISVDVVADLFVFFNLDPEAPPLDPQLTDLIDDLENEVPGLRNMELVTRPAMSDPDTESFTDVAYPVNANWKIVMENFLECYHCRGAHPGVRDLFALDDLTLHGYPLWAKQKSSVPGLEGGKQLFYTLFPNMTLSFVTGGLPNVTIFEFAVPDGPTKTTFGHGGYYCLSNDMLGEALPQDYVQVGREDKDLCESAQKGMYSLGYGQGRFMYDPTHSEITEEGSHAFSRFIMKHVGL